VTSSSPHSLDRPNSLTGFGASDSTYGRSAVPAKTRAVLTYTSVVPTAAAASATFSAPVAFVNQLSRGSASRTSRSVTVARWMTKSG
jgi:hypothetical protein